MQGAFDRFVKNSISPTQYVSLRFGGSESFHMLSAFVEGFCGCSLITMNAALQVWRIGDRDQKITVPYKASGPLPPATSETTTKTQ